MSLVNWHIIKDKIWVHWFGLFPGEYNLLVLFAYIRIEWHFPLMCPFRYSCRSLFSISAELLLSCATENTEVSSAKSFTVDSVFSGKSCMYIRTKSGQKIDPSGTPTFTDNYSEVCPLSKILWNLFVEKFLISFSSESETPIDFSL